MDGFSCETLIYWLRIQCGYTSYPSSFPSSPPSWGFIQLRTGFGDDRNCSAYTYGKDSVTSLLPTSLLFLHHHLLILSLLPLPPPSIFPAPTFLPSLHPSPSNDLFGMAAAACRPETWAVKLGGFWAQMKNVETLKHLLWKLSTLLTNEEEFIWICSVFIRKFSGVSL